MFLSVEHMGLQPCLRGVHVDCEGQVEVGLLEDWGAGVGFLRAWNACSILLVHCTQSGWPFLLRSERGEDTEEKLGKNLL